MCLPDLEEDRIFSCERRSEWWHATLSIGFLIPVWFSLGDTALAITSSPAQASPSESDEAFR